MIYIVDIDETICITPSIDGKRDYANSIPIPNRISVINKLYDDGHTIKYWTARGSGSGLDWTELTTHQLIRWGCKFHEIKLGKPTYDVWIDDKAVNDKDFFNDDTN